MPAGRMTRRYIPPPWAQRQIANQLVPLFRKDIVSKLSVHGHKSGRWRTVPVAVLDVGGERYLVRYRGVSETGLGTSASARRGRLMIPRARGLEEISDEEVPVAKRPQLLAAYERQFGRVPNRSGWCCGPYPTRQTTRYFCITTTGPRPSVSFG